MSSLLLTPAERKDLQARAQSLKPVVLVGSAGLTPPVLQEIDRALGSHELIKVRLAGASRDDREQAAEEIADSLSCAAVQIIGSTLVLFRPQPDDDQA
jgi:RNA-binding protein